MAFEIGKSVAGSSVPAGAATYTVFPLWFIACMSLSQSGAFFGAFFGTRGPGGEWPHAWWAFGMLGSIIWPWFAFATKLIKTSEGFEVHSPMYAVIGPMSAVKRPDIETMEIAKNCCGTYIKVTLTDDGVASAKKEAGCCKCCVGKTTGFAFLDHSKDLTAFINDNFPGV